MERRTEAGRLLSRTCVALVIPFLTGCPCSEVGTGRYDARLIPVARDCDPDFDLSVQEQEGELEILNFASQQCVSEVRFSKAINVSMASGESGAWLNYLEWRDSRPTETIAENSRPDVDGGLENGLLKFHINGEYHDFDGAYRAQEGRCNTLGVGHEAFLLTFASFESSGGCTFGYEVCLKEK